MKKGFKVYLPIWIIFFVVFNALIFLTPNEVNGMYKFGGAFWIGYAFIVIAFIGQIIIAHMALAEERKEKLFLNLSMFKISITGLVLTLITGSISMFVYEFPKWLGGLICFVVLIFNYMSVVKAAAAAEIVDEIDQKVKEETSFIKTLTADAQNLSSVAADAQMKAVVKKAYEAIRFSDPVSAKEIEDIEAEIKADFIYLSKAVKNADLEAATNACEKLLASVKERNMQCKGLK